MTMPTTTTKIAPIKTSPVGIVESSLRGARRRFRACLGRPVPRRIGQRTSQAERTQPPEPPKLAILYALAIVRVFCLKDGAQPFWNQSAITRRGP